MMCPLDNAEILTLCNQPITKHYNFSSSQQHPNKILTSYYTQHQSALSMSTLLSASFLSRILFFIQVMTNGLQPTTPPEKSDHHNSHQQEDSPEDKVTVFIFQLRKIFKICPIDPGDEGQGNEDCRKDGQDLHDLI